MAIVCWRICTQVEIHMKGKLNVLADAFSRLPRFKYGRFVLKTTEHVPVPANTSMYLLDEAFRNQRFTSDETLIYDDNFMYDGVLHDLVDRELFHCLQWYSDDPTTMSYVNLPAIIKNPLSLKWLKAAQDNDLGLQLQLTTNPECFHIWPMDGVNLICHQPIQGNWKTCLTNTTVDASIEFMHDLLCHPGQSRLAHGMRMYYHPQMLRKVRAFHCDICQRVKTGERGYEHLAPHDVNLLPWQCVDVDLIGPWKFKVGGTRESAKVYEINALTCIDRVTGFPDGCRIDRKTTAHVAKKTKQVWLSCYPRPRFIGHNNGGYLLGQNNALWNIVTNTLNWRTDGTVHTEYAKFIVTETSRLNFQQK